MISAHQDVLGNRVDYLQGASAPSMRRAAGLTEVPQAVPGPPPTGPALAQSRATLRALIHVEAANIAHGLSIPASFTMPATKGNDTGVKPGNEPALVRAGPINSYVFPAAEAPSYGTPGLQPGTAAVVDRRGYSPPTSSA